MITVKLNGIFPFVSQQEVDALAPELAAAHDALADKTCAGGEYTGWLTLPYDYDREEFACIEQAAADIRKHSKVLVVVGIGGSYLGARAVIELLHSPNYNLMADTQIFFAGCNLSADALDELTQIIGERDWCINVISKSGTTTEPAVAFRYLRAKLREKYGDNANKRIYATTDKQRGALKQLADSEGYETFVIPDDIGGRFSVLTAVGLLPIAVSGANIKALMQGAQQAAAVLDIRDMSNPAWQYAAGRNALLRKGKTIEVLGCYQPHFRMMVEWWKQLFGESEGKDGKGIFPAGLELTADLHSMGQYMQDGMRNVMETTVALGQSRAEVTLQIEQGDGDGLNFLAGMTLDEINEKAFQGTYLAHIDGGVPNMIIEVPKRGEENLGALIYFYELACGLSGLLLGVNPFDQPGVEDYKKNMFALLGKPGFEARRAALESRL
ncbi:MAG: glucose-6-phosphate isomerase [Oscillospiraceae bacterium]|nr:glucose-6-phosphate isomerase [Oscillospiraceae bacterium]